jgi:hypothetical protein
MLIDGWVCFAVQQFLLLVPFTYDDLLSSRISLPSNLILSTAIITVHVNLDSLKSKFPAFRQKFRVVLSLQHTTMAHTHPIFSLFWQTFCLNARKYRKLKCRDSKSVVVAVFLCWLIIVFYYFWSIFFFLKFELKLLWTVTCVVLYMIISSIFVQRPLHITSIALPILFYFVAI